MVKISVIVPVYNVEKYLERCLESIVNQTFKDIEIICVNDGSTDNSRQILDKYNKYPNFKVIEQKNAGLSEARNTGLDAALGEYISFIDSDDFIDSNFLETLYHAAIDNNADIACASIIRENNEKHYNLITYNHIECTADIREKFELAKSPRFNFVWNKIYKRDFLIQNNIRFVPGMIYEDLCFTPDVLEKSGILVTCPNTVYHYWKHKNTLIKGNTDKSRADKIFGSKYLIEKCKKYNLKPPSRGYLLYKEDFSLLGIPILRIYHYEATKIYSLFGVIPYLKISKSV